MISKKRSLIVALATAVVLAIGGCAADGEGSGSPTAGGSAGEPVSGGTLRVLEVAQPTGFDPVQVFSSASMPITYTALYGRFIIADPETGGYTCGLCQSFDTEDGGATWTVTTRPGMTFTDGTAFDAAALKYNWDRMKDPQFGSASAGIASQIDHIDVVDETTAKLTMVVPTPGLEGLFPIYALQWIASPTALEKGQNEFNKNPVGAGPFVLDSWTPNGLLTLKKNPDYYDAPKPYLDSLEIQGVTDETQRMNSLLSGESDLIMTSDRSTISQAESAGFIDHTYILNGGVGIMFNEAKPPFDDVRARQAVSYALDLDKIADSVSNGADTAPETLFNEDSPFFEDLPLHTYDPEKAQELFDELAAEGKPLDFQYTVFPGNATRVFDALQSQLKAYDNVTVTADQRDTSQQGVVGTTGDYQSLTSSVAFVDPGSRLWGQFSSKADRTNYSRFSDPEMDAALDAQFETADVEEQKAQWKIVQERYIALQPYLLYSHSAFSAVTTDAVGGVDVYGYTTPPAADLWLQQ
ncbi:ABC transporter substrate-binding protein [Rathayibacter sp. VKM Ac-2835]|uniref:ABC transporter substrate-binding protein n=1 Tax=Rathayibacter sp. VKM Ac-2835 TaxID=2739043 RepID=UPI0015634F79|nr:ABC transporter substrate-binding protein [Rathayibacter sp. VKM Ac-2835]